MALIRKLFWFSLFCVFTVGFVTLFDHGFATADQFVTDAKGEANDFIALWHSAKTGKDHGSQLGH